MLSFCSRRQRSCSLWIHQDKGTKLLPTTKSHTSEDFILSWPLSIWVVQAPTTLEYQFEVMGPHLSQSQWFWLCPYCQSWCCEVWCLCGQYCRSLTLCRVVGIPRPKMFCRDWGWGVHLESMLAFFLLSVWSVWSVWSVRSVWAWSVWCGLRGLCDMCGLCGPWISNLNWI